MLIFTKSQEILPIWEDVADEGYGFSIMREPKEIDYDRNIMIEVLSDWGWSGMPEKKPEWLL
ncbi:hypothetical protein [Desulfatibacillum aliphaticivorans]|uniref:hypothetical protein n=1 Tax=Desulfatibacillum aliphaticivorans TaxID=218208 RepID=UPI00042A61AB|nr:hypothetical protein [Desulfatibacillum aliphaticivorans]